MSNFFNRVDLKEGVITFVSAEAASSLRNDDAMDTETVVNNLAYAALYTFFRNKYNMPNDESTMYYLKCIGQSVISEGLAEMASKAIGENKEKIKAKKVIVDGLVKYIAVMVGDNIGHSLLDTAHVV